MRNRLNWQRLRWIPLAIGSSVLLISWFYLAWNTTVGEAAPSLRFRTKNTIAGIMQDGTEIFSADALLTGQYQQWLSRSIGVLSPVFKAAVTWKAQIYYTVFGVAATSNVVVGEHQQLMERSYLDEYCNRDMATLRTSGEAWAARLRETQDYVEAHGKVFLYVITPSKVAQQPEYMPAGINCPGRNRDPAQKLAIYGDILAHHGVRFVDTASGLADARKEYGIEMFPRGGVHWNALGATLGALKVIDAINSRREEPLLGSLSFTWQVSYNPRGADRDLLDIMNLRNPDTHYPVPEVTYSSTPPPGGCQTVTITEVGGSFLHGLNSVLLKLACPPTITEWFYWDQRRIHQVGGRVYEPPIDAEARRRSLVEADVVLLEENESIAPDSAHATKMMDEVRAQSERPH
ncbi:MAG TPA: hypothetical protein VFL55_00910 [Acetobacteraceae bacterium]|nr:hypothetical protein [Acetobacteraceae bacterium]